MMKVVKRIRVNARLPDYEGKYRDEITQEFTIELEEENDILDALIDRVNDGMAIQLGTMLKKIDELGGRDYTEAT
ncbi:MAG TPA: hypothetical protein VMW50_03240 [Dehalococcoidia bacterium]|nr:hypothetical protein [Dehalococcoidia bacterium]